ncbi:hypothetical protein ACOMHN_055587 [Nucella lapillus]
MSVLESETIQVDANKFQYHTVIQAEACNVQLELQSRSRGGGLVSGKSYNPNKPRIARRRPSVEEQVTELVNKPTLLTVEDLGMAYPFHMLMDKDLHILQCGESLRELVPEPITNDTVLTDLGSITLPIISPTFRFIREFINSVFFIRVRTGDYKSPVVLKGQFMWLPTCKCLLYMGSPHLLSWNDFKEMHVRMSDIPLYDCTRELVLLNQQRIAEIDVAKRLDETTIEFKRMSKALEAEKQKTEELLHEMMPRKVAMQLRLYGRVKAERYDSCTVLFSDIVTFTDITAMCQADQVVNMLNDMYHRFDTHTEAHVVYKVETIGDAYMAVTGVPEFQEDHAERMADFAMDMLEEAGNVPSPASGLPLQIRVGLHTGAVVSGVIGKKKPRFDIYGDTVNTASLMESTSIPGRIQVSDPTFEKLYPKGYVFKSRGEIDVKGKGKVVTYFLVGTLDRDLYQPDDNFSSLPDVLDPEAETSPSRKVTKRALLSKPANTINIVENRVGKGRPSFSWQTLLNQFSSGDKPNEEALTPAPTPPPPPQQKKKQSPQSTTQNSQTLDHYNTTWNLCPLPLSAYKDTTKEPQTIKVEKKESPEQVVPQPISPLVQPTQKPQVVITAPAEVVAPPPPRTPPPPRPPSPPPTLAPVHEIPPKPASLTQFVKDTLTSTRRPSVLWRIEPSQFLKNKHRTLKPKKLQPYTTQQMNILPFGPIEEDSYLSGSFFDRKVFKKRCTIL